MNKKIIWKIGLLPIMLITIGVAALLNVFSVQAVLVQNDLKSQIIPTNVSGIIKYCSTKQNSSTTIQSEYGSAISQCLYGNAVKMVTKNITGALQLCRESAKYDKNNKKTVPQLITPAFCYDKLALIRVYADSIEKKGTKAALSICELKNKKAAKESCVKLVTTESKNYNNRNGFALPYFGTSTIPTWSAIQPLTSSTQVPAVGSSTAVASVKPWRILNADTKRPIEGVGIAFAYLGIQNLHVVSDGEGYVTLPTGPLFTNDTYPYIPKMEGYLPSLPMDVKNYPDQVVMLSPEPIGGATITNVVGTSSPSPDGGTYISGQVVDALGTIQKKITVGVTQTSLHATTDEMGNFSILVFDSGGYRLYFPSITAEPNYYDVQAVKGKTVTVKIVLKK